MLTKQLAEKICLVDYKNLTGEVITRSKEVILDTIGVTLAGAATDAAAILNEYSDRCGGTGSSTVLGRDKKTSAANAALVNGSTGHILDYDDVSWTTIGHPAVVVASAALASGEEFNSSGMELISAFVAGYETTASIGRAVIPEICRRGWHSTSTLGVFGAAAAAGKICGLNPAQMTNALGIAGSLASGVKTNFGTMTKHLHAGSAASNGVMAALLSKKGFTASTEILEADNGFCAAFSPNYNPDVMVEEFGRPYDLIGNGAILKKWPSCYSTHPCIEAVLELRSKYSIDYSRVREIRVGITPYASDILFYSRPETGFEGKFSNQFCAAVALVRGKVSLLEFTDNTVRDKAVRDLAGKVIVYVDNELGKGKYFLPPGEGPSRTRVKIVLNDGSIFSREILIAKGAPGRRLSPEEITQKYKSCAGMILEKNAVKSSIRSLMNLEKASSICTVTSSFSLCGPKRLRESGGL